MKSTNVALEVPDTFTDGALASIKDSAETLSSRLVAEAGRIAADNDRAGNTVYEDDVKGAVDHIVSPPKRWQKVKAYLRAISTFLAGIVMATLGTLGFRVDDWSDNTPWLVVASLVLANVLVYIAFVAYKEA